MEDYLEWLGRWLSGCIWNSQDPHTNTEFAVCSPLCNSCLHGGDKRIPLGIAITPMDLVARPFLSEKGGRAFKNVSRFRHALHRHAHTLGQAPIYDMPHTWKWQKKKNNVCSIYSFNTVAVRTFSEGNILVSWGSTFLFT